MMRLVVARHGETAWNSLGRYQGCIDTELSALGRRQTRALAQALAGYRIEAVYSSPLRRALETARVVADAQGCALHTDAAFREICHGRWEGLTVAEVAAKFPRLWKLWRSRPHRVVMPGGESLGDVDARVTRGIKRIVQRHVRGTVCVVTHGVTARLILAQALGYPRRALWRIDSPPTAISELTVEPGRYVVHRLNVIEHLPAPPRTHVAL